MLGRLLHKKGDKQKSKVGKGKEREHMGCGSSQPATKGPPPSSAKAGTAGQAPKAKAQESTTPDVGLTETHTYVKFLGRGGTGDVHLYEDKADGQRVAIKLMKRPLPKIIMPNILREIKVRGCSC